jgi:hypothetical protein
VCGNNQANDVAALVASITPRSSANFEQPFAAGREAGGGNRLPPASAATRPKGTLVIEPVIANREPVWTHARISSHPGAVVSRPNPVMEAEIFHMVWIVDISPIDNHRLFHQPAELGESSCLNSFHSVTTTRHRIPQPGIRVSSIKTSGRSAASIATGS